MAAQQKTEIEPEVQVHRASGERAVHPRHGASSRSLNPPRAVQKTPAFRLPVPVPGALRRNTGVPAAVQRRRNITGRDLRLDRRAQFARVPHADPPEKSAQGPAEDLRSEPAKIELPGDTGNFGAAVAAFRPGKAAVRPVRVVPEVREVSGRLLPAVGHDRARDDRELPERSPRAGVGQNVRQDLALHKGYVRALDRALFHAEHEGLHGVVDPAVDGRQVGAVALDPVQRSFGPEDAGRFQGVRSVPAARFARYVFRFFYIFCYNG